MPTTVPHGPTPRQKFSLINAIVLFIVAVVILFQIWSHSTFLSCAGTHDQTGAQASTGGSSNDVLLRSLRSATSRKDAKSIEELCHDVAAGVGLKGDPEHVDAHSGQRILVLGGASFIGSHLVDLLLSLGYAVRVVDSLDASTSNIEFLDLMSEKLEFRVGNYSHQPTLLAALEGVQGVICVSGDLNAIEGLLDTNAPSAELDKVIIATSSPAQIKEYHERLQDSSSFESKTMFSQSKPLKKLVFAFDSVYGPRDPLQNVYTMLTKVLDGQQDGFGNLIHVKDLARALVLGYQGYHHGMMVHLDLRIPSERVASSSFAEEACRAKKLFGFTRRYDLADTVRAMSNGSIAGSQEAAFWTKSLAVGGFEHHLPGWSAMDAEEKNNAIRSFFSDNGIPVPVLEKMVSKLQVLDRCKKTRILIIVRTSPGTCGSRIPRIKSSWAADAGPNIKVVGFMEGDTDEEVPANDTFLPMVTSSECAKRFADDKGHGVRFCCKTANSLWYTRQADGLMNWDWDWVYLVDDDVYVFLDHLQSQLCHDFSDGVPKVVGLPGCNTKVCKGMCGGGGFGFSKADLQTYLGVGSTREEFLSEFIDTCRVCENWDDVTVGTVATKRSMKLERMPGSEPWKMDVDSQVDKALSFHELPTIWHYVREDMNKVHEIHQKAGEVMTLRHFTNKELKLSDVGHVAKQQSSLRTKLGLKKRKPKFHGHSGEVKLEVIWKDSACTEHSFTIGRFKTARECAPHVIASSRCGTTFMLAPGQYVWGCRCCDSVATKGNKSIWQTYRIVDKE